MKKLFGKSATILAACIAVCAGSAGCVEKAENHYEGVHSFKVTATPLSGDYGSDEAPLKMPTSFTGADAYEIRIEAEALDIEGNLLTDYNATVTLSSEPGHLSQETIDFVNGKASATVALRFAFGTTRIWVEDTERVSVTDSKYVSCPNGKLTQDGMYCEPSYATGASIKAFTFEPQTIRGIQYNPDRPDGSSPLLKEYGQIKALKGHDLVVTNVVSTGFYITDLGDEDYNSIFIFTYSQPSRVDIGDRVCEVSGGIAEFTGMTQLQFPSWGIQNKEQSTAEDIDPAPEDGDSGVDSCIDPKTHEVRACTEEELEAKKALIDCWYTYNDAEPTKEQKKAFGYIDPPEPRAITNPSFFSVDNTAGIEALESSIVTVQNVRLSTEFLDCDDNGNLKIESGSDEASCRNTCTSNDRCTELSSLTSYDQWRAWTIDGNGEFSVASSSLINGFDITAETWTYKDGLVQDWVDNGSCSYNSSTKEMTCAACYEWKDEVTDRRNVRCPDRRLSRVTGNLKQVLPGCSGANSNVECYASMFKNNMIMKVIEPRFSNDLIFDEAYNYKEQVKFQECISDKREDGCLDACKISSLWCTCDAYADSYRKAYPASDASLATCPARN